ncbi:uncharacterized protein BT62DRAFT_1006689 [Guyanagaster necrorhizus]|uniref:Uncharacterized protein n=1 Tax=Guyanagaster necrorhizus TaxID=856835 RepID=A0A9P7VS52_9AGAR|nr:uncharacterized protein BT62DRAFT_1006689 [Guyanagaster necrorhizus MCA 3950]KAG7445658.1 hypothetical protein BT62DRAFT_1006689 [Guyanagaster necrorhizus MCA 3950]
MALHHDQSIPIGLPSPLYFACHHISDKFLRPPLALQRPLKLKIAKLRLMSDRGTELDGLGCLYSARLLYSIAQAGQCCSVLAGGIRMKKATSTSSSSVMRFSSSHSHLVAVLDCAVPTCEQAHVSIDINKTRVLVFSVCAGVIVALWKKKERSCRIEGKRGEAFNPQPHIEPALLRESPPVVGKSLDDEVQIIVIS